MNFSVITMTFICAAFALAFLVKASVRSLRVSSTRRWIATRQTPITPVVGALVERRLAQRSLATAVGSLVGLVVAIGLVVAVVPDSFDLGSWVVMFFAVAGGAVGSGILAFHAALRPVSGTIRVAHSSAAPIGDFVNPMAVRFIRGGAALAALTALTAALLPFWRGTGFGPDRSGAVWVGLSLLLLMWASAEVAIHRLLDQPQRSANALELVWNDAIRSQLIADLFAVPCSLAIGAAALAALADASTVPAPLWTSPFLLVTPLMMVNALVVMCLGHRVVQSRHRSGAIAAAQAA